MKGSLSVVTQDAHEVGGGSRNKREPRDLIRLCSTGGYGSKAAADVNGVGIGECRRMWSAVSGWQAHPDRIYELGEEEIAVLMKALPLLNCGIFDEVHMACIVAMAREMTSYEAADILDAVGNMFAAAEIALREKVPDWPWVVRGLDDHTRAAIAMHLRGDLDEMIEATRRSMAGRSRRTLSSTVAPVAMVG